MQVKYDLIRYEVLTYITIFQAWSGRCVVANVMNGDIVVSEFKPQLRNYVHFRDNIFGKGINYLVPPPMG